MKFLPFLMLALFLGANYYVILRLWQMLPAAGFLRPLFVVCAVALVVSIFAVLLFRESVPLGLASVVYTAGTAWIIILLYLLLVILVADLLPFTGLYDRTAVLRSNMGTFAVVAGIIAFIMVAGNINYHHKRRVHLTVDTSAATGKLLESPLRIVAVSDLHLGYTIGRRELSRWVKMINAENPDIVLIAGDLIDADVRPLYKQDMAATLLQIHSRYGVYLSPGNHEYISGIDKSLDFIRSAGITVLKDSVVTIAWVAIAGRDDLTNRKRMPLAELVPDSLKGHPLVVIDHQPVALDEAAGAGAAFQISGHTHRGQVWPLSWLTDMIYEDSHGLEDKDGTLVYVSSGLGIWGGKFRIGTVSEYVVIDLE